MLIDIDSEDWNEVMYTGINALWCQLHRVLACSYLSFFLSAATVSFTFSLYELI